MLKFVPACQAATHPDPYMIDSQATVWHGTTILAVRKGGHVVVVGDGQVSQIGRASWWERV